MNLCKFPVNQGTLYVRDHNGIGGLVRNGSNLYYAIQVSKTYLCAVFLFTSSNTAERRRRRTPSQQTVGPTVLQQGEEHFRTRVVASCAVFIGAPLCASCIKFILRVRYVLLHKVRTLWRPMRRRATCRKLRLPPCYVSSASCMAEQPNIKRAVKAIMRDANAVKQFICLTKQRHHL